MKKISFLIGVCFLLLFCGGEEVNLELFTPEAFAYDLGDSWEVNAIVNLKGFVQKENNGEQKFEASINLSADLETPEGETVKNIFSDVVNYSLDEEIIDIPLEIQFELDSSYVLGDYKIKLTVQDNFSEGIVSGVIKFDLSE